LNSKPATTRPQDLPTCQPFTLHVVDPPPSPFTSLNPPPFEDEPEAISEPDVPVKATNHVPAPVAAAPVVIAAPPLTATSGPECPNSHC